MIKSCLFCKSPFYVDPCRVKIGKGKFCSRLCFYQSTRENTDSSDYFWSRVDKNGPSHPYFSKLGPCWLWVAGRFAPPNNYGVVRVVGRGNGRAHRRAWELSYGPIPNEATVLHTCDNPPCVNPSHLYLGTHRQNAQDRESRNRRLILNGENHPKAKLTSRQVIQIYYQKNKATRKQVAVQFGVSVSAVNNIWYKRRWKHVLADL